MALSSLSLFRGHLSADEYGSFFSCSVRPRQESLCGALAIPGSWAPVCTPSGATPLPGMLHTPFATHGSTPLSDFLQLVSSWPIFGEMRSDRKPALGSLAQPLASQEKLILHLHNNSPGLCLFLLLCHFLPPWGSRGLRSPPHTLPPSQK